MNADSAATNRLAVCFNDCLRSKFPAWVISMCRGCTQQGALLRKELPILPESASSLNDLEATPRPIIAFLGLYILQFLQAF